MTDLNFTCANPVDHSPRPLVPVKHHILPKSWGGLDSNNTVRICGTCHDNVHDLLNKYVHQGGTPPWLQRRYYSASVRTWAAKAWSNRPSDKPPYTASATTHGA